MAAIGWLDAAPCMSEAGEDCDEYCDRGADDAGYGFPSGLVSGPLPALRNSGRPSR